MKANFSSSLQIAAIKAREIIIETGLDLRLVRDDRGLLTFYFNCPRFEIPSEVIKQIEIVCLELGAYSSKEDAVKTSADEHDPDTFFSEGWSEVWIEPEGVSPFMIPVRDLTAWGRDWAWLGRERPSEKAKRIVFHGLKGGVGRSTALAVLAHSQAKAGRKVLVLDLDIESPGATGAMLASDSLPAFGVIDWITENLVGSGAVDAEDCYSESPLSVNELGSIYVVPAMGSNSCDFVSKLGRAYIDINGSRFSDRVESMLCALEERLAPDLVLIDSRAGIHEVAAFSITRLSDLSLLFFVDTEQNWLGYKQLFEFWKSRPEVLRQVRRKVLAVRALASESSDFQTFLERSHSLFSDCLYDEVPPEADTSELFTFDLKDDSSPHFPPIIYLHPRLHEKNLLRPVEQGGVSQADIGLAFGNFMRRLDEFLGSE